MPERSAHASWNGNLKEGKGNLKLGSGRYEGPYTYVSRFETGEGGTNPEELIGAAHAGCYSMFLAAILSGDGHQVNDISTTATVHLGQKDGGPAITKIELDCTGDVAGIEEAEHDLRRLGLELSYRY